MLSSSSRPVRLGRQVGGAITIDSEFGAPAGEDAGRLGGVVLNTVDERQGSRAEANSMHREVALLAKLLARSFALLPKLLATVFQDGVRLLLERSGKPLCLLLERSVKPLLHLSQLVSLVRQDCVQMAIKGCVLSGRNLFQNIHRDGVAARHRRGASTLFEEEEEIRSKVNCAQQQQQQQ